MRSIHRLETGRVDRTAAGLRALLVVAAAGQVWMAAPGLAHADGHGLTHHAARHMGSLGLALAFAFVLVAWMPRRATAMVPLVGVLGASLLVTSAFDLAGGRTMMIAEVAHLPEIVGSAVVVLFALSARRDARRVLAV